MTYVIQSALKGADYTPRGGALELIYSHDPEIVCAGPADTGKTLAACWKAHTLASKYPGCQGAIVRKTQKSVYGSVLQTWDRVIKGAPVVPYGGEKPEKYVYANGSTIWIGGMDNPDKVLSSERDFYYVNQAEELALDDWEKMTTRATGRSAVIPYPQVFADCNPSGSLHWILQRAKAGRLTIVKSYHRDNPTIYNEDGTLTPNGERRLAALKGLTGVRYKRLYLGEWATAEGAVYDTFSGETHVKERPDSEFVSWALAMDEGYTNPAVILLIGVDPDGRLHIAREFYERGKLQGDVVAKARQWYLEKKCRIAAVDAAAAGLIADMINAGMHAEPHKGRVLDGIGAVQNLLKVQGDGLPRLTVDPSCVDTINEFESYVWKPQKDEPVKENDHALDALRYYVICRGLEGGPLPANQPTQQSKWTQSNEPADDTGRWRKY